MTAIWIAHTRPENPETEGALLAFLRSTHADELRQGIPEVTSYTHHREVLDDGRIRFLSIGVAPTLSAHELRDRVYGLGPSLTPIPGVSLTDGEAPFLLFADEV